MKINIDTNLYINGKTYKVIEFEKLKDTTYYLYWVNGFSLLIFFHNTPETVGMIVSNKPKKDLQYFLTSTRMVPPVFKSSLAVPIDDIEEEFIELTQNTFLDQFNF
jgi:hypothetical protein